MGEHGNASVKSDVERRLTALLVQSVKGDKAAYRDFLL